jgi:hypothetical protein
MDFSSLAADALPYLVYYIPAMAEAGNFVGGKILERIVDKITDGMREVAWSWFGKLIGKIEDSPLP